MIFQPHLYSRTRILAGDFGRVLGRSTVYRTVVTDVFPSREKPSGDVSGDLIVQASRASGGNIEYIPDKNQVADAIVDDLEVGDMVLTLGAGDIDTVGRQILRMLREPGV